MASIEDIQNNNSGTNANTAAVLTKKVEDERVHVIEAAIVRIMKIRKQFSHQQLIAEVLTQITFFKPNPKVILCCCLCRMYV